MSPANSSRRPASAVATHGASCGSIPARQRHDLRMLRAHLIDVRDARWIARGQAIPQHRVLGLVMQVQREEVEPGVVPDDRGAVEVAGLDFADEHRQLAVQPAEDSVHEDQARGIATGGLPLR